jgi:hypothetical protein
MKEEDERIEIGDVTKQLIIDTIIEPYYTKFISNTIKGKQLWRKIGIVLETVSKTMVAAGGILSFSAGYYHDDTLSFVSGSVSCLSLALLQLSSFSYKENKKQGQELNIILKKLNLDTVPTLYRNVNETSVLQNASSPPPPQSPYQPPPRTPSPPPPRTPPPPQLNDTVPYVVHHIVPNDINTNNTDYLNNIINKINYLHELEKSILMREKKINNYMNADVYRSNSRPMVISTSNSSFEELLSDQSDLSDDLSNIKVSYV